MIERHLPPGSELLIIAENVFKLSETGSSQIFPFLGKRRSNIKRTGHTTSLENLRLPKMGVLN